MVEYLAGNRIIGTDDYQSASYTTESAYDTTGVTYGAETKADTTTPRRGVKIDSGSSAIGKKIKKVATKLRGVSSPTGNLYYKVYRSGIAISTSEALDVSTLTSSFVLKELTLDTGVTLQANDRVVMEYPSVTGSMAVHTLYNNSPNTIGGGFKHTSWNGTAWSDITYDIMFDFDSTPASGVTDTIIVKPTNVVNGSLYYAKDTNKEYVLNNNTWTEL